MKLYHGTNSHHAALALIRKSGLPDNLPRNPWSPTQAGDLGLFASDNPEFAQEYGRYLLEIETDDFQEIQRWDESDVEEGVAHAAGGEYVVYSYQLARILPPYNLEDLTEP